MFLISKKFRSSILPGGLVVNVSWFVTFSSEINQDPFKPVCVSVKWRIRSFAAPALSIVCKNFPRFTSSESHTFSSIGGIGRWKLIKLCTVIYWKFCLVLSWTKCLNSKVKSRLFGCMYRQMKHSDFTRV